MLERFINLDCFGTSILLRYNMKNEVKTVTGAIFTVFSIVISGLLIAGFGRDFFKRENPVFIPETVSPVEYPKFIINNQNFTYAFILEDINGLPQEDTSLFYTEFKYRKWVKEQGKDWNLAQEVILPTKKCTADKFGDPNLFEKKLLHSWICPEFGNLEVGGYWDTNFIGHLMIDVNRCLEGRENPFTKEKCGTTEATSKKLFDKFFYSSIIQEVLVNPSNYGKPLTADYTTKYRTLFNGGLKREIYKFKMFKVTSDYGWIIENKSDEKLLGFSSIDFDIMEIDSDTVQYFNTMIYFDKSETNFYREYPKIQQLLAEVGGILKIFLLIMTIAAELTNKYWVDYKLANTFINSVEIKSFKKFFDSTYNKDNLISEEKPNSKSNSNKIYHDINQSNLINNAPNIQSINKVSNILANNVRELKEKELKLMEESNLKCLDFNNKSIDFKQNSAIDLKYKNSSDILNINEFSKKKDYVSNIRSEVLMKERKNTIAKKRTRKYGKKKKENLNNQDSYISDYKNIILEKDSNNMYQTILNKINSTKKYLGSGNQIMSFWEYFYASAPFPCKSNDKRKLYLNSLAKTANKYLDTLISVESIIDTNISLRKMKKLLFNSSQLEAINHIQSSTFETFFENINKCDKDYILNFDNNDEIFDSKRFLYCLRKNYIFDEKMSCEKIANVMKSAEQKKNFVDQKIVSDFLK